MFQQNVIYHKQQAGFGQWAGLPSPGLSHQIRKNAKITEQGHSKWRNHWWVNAARTKSCATALWCCSSLCFLARTERTWNGSFLGWKVPSGGTLNSEPAQQLLGLSDVSNQKRQNNHVDVSRAWMSLQDRELNRKSPRRMPRISLCFHVRSRFQAWLESLGANRCSLGLISYYRPLHFREKVGDERTQSGCSSDRTNRPVWCSTFKGPCEGLVSCSCWRRRVREHSETRQRGVKTVLYSMNIHNKAGTAVSGKHKE